MPSEANLAVNCLRRWRSEVWHDYSGNFATASGGVLKMKPDDFADVYRRAAGGDSDAQRYVTIMPGNFMSVIKLDY